MEKVLNKCPVCKGKLEYTSLMQYSNIYGIKQNGELTSKRIRKEENGPMDAGYICCTNEDCNFETDCDLKSVNHTHIKIWQKGNKHYYSDSTENQNTID